MKLKRFCVEKFRSIMNSGWVDCDDITTLVGINEAGKSNLLLALWKLNPAKDGKIDPLHDLPIKLYSTLRDQLSNIAFVKADFELTNAEIAEIQKDTDCSSEELAVVRVTRFYDGKYNIEFPDFGIKSDISANKVAEHIATAQSKVSCSEEVTKGEAGIKFEAECALNDSLKNIEGKERLTKENRDFIFQKLSLKCKAAKHSAISPIIQNAWREIENEFAPLFVNPPQDNQTIVDYVVSHLPTFVYYSNYGNLDSQIYLPYAIKWLKGEKVPGIDNTAKVRTLKVLFDFVHLNPTEILELGKDPKIIAAEKNGYSPGYNPTEQEIKEVAEQKTKRSILLQSAATDLTQRFKQWWKQGSYVFRFEADGEYFKIWVSDDKRPEEVELEKRSTGLQWFLSFYLVFLVESQEAHKDSVLLLDEAGLSLHPLAQKDLIAFFESLSEENQLIHTTHSPFLVDTNSIERVKVVYMDNNGYTVVSNDLRSSNDKLNEKSIYAVHAALGLSVSDIMLQGCRPVVVEGASDQHYFNAIKTFLIRSGKIFPKEEIVFMPSGGVRGVPGLVSIISSKENDLPTVVLDSDKSGDDARKKLESGLYLGQTDKLISVASFAAKERAEVEDIIPESLMNRYFDRSLFRDVEDEAFADVYDETLPLVEQVQNFAEKYSTQLPKGWKVDLARNVKIQLQKQKEDDIPKDYMDMWIKMFNLFCH